MEYKKNYAKVLSSTELADKFLIGILISASLIFYIYTLQLSHEASQVPQLLIYISVIIILVYITKEYATKHFDRFIKRTPFNIERDTERNEVENSTPAKSVQQETMEFRPVAKQILILGMYIWSLSNIGFFATNLVFMFAYIYFGDGRGIVSPALWAVGVNIFVYYLFVHWLQFGSLFRLGFNWVI